MRGILLRRNSNLNHLHTAFDNEVSALIQITNGEQHPCMYESLATRKTSDVKAVRELIFTNAKFPEYRSPLSEYDNDDIRFQNEARLICRAKYIQHRKDQTRNAKVVGEAIINLTEADVESVNGRRVSNVEQMIKWTSSIAASPDCSQPYARGEERQKTFGDGCCGGGGATRAADQLGLKISFGFVSIIMLISLFACS
jgi:hypothetical protein